MKDRYDLLPSMRRKKVVSADDTDSDSSLQAAKVMSFITKIIIIKIHFQDSF